MAKSTRGLMIAAAAASLFLAGCATQGTDNGSVTTAPVATATVPADAGAAKNMASCKGQSHCKAKVAKHHVTAAHKAAHKAHKAAKAAKTAAAKADAAAKDADAAAKTAADATAPATNS